MTTFLSVKIIARFIAGGTKILWGTFASLLQFKSVFGQLFVSIYN